jgi:tetratricopeptide (TPR) repeat protein
VIGQDCWERDESLVAPFIQKMGDQMTYRIAIDDKEGNKKGKMAETWMAAAGQNGIPTAFLINGKGQIAWIGHPMSLQDSVIEQVMGGTWDLAKAAAEYETNQKKNAEMQAFWTKFNRDVSSKNWDAAMTALDDLEKATPEAQRDNLLLNRFNVLVAKKDFATANKVARQFSDAHPDNPVMQNELAWQIATNPSITERDLALAETIATRANDAAKGKDAGIMDTLARVYFLQGRNKDAINLQEKALSGADGEMKESLQKTLEAYKKGQLPKDNT